MQKEEMMPILAHHDLLIRLESRRHAIDRFGRIHGSERKQARRHVIAAMKRATVAILAAVLALSCASADKNAKNDRVKLELAQLVGASPVQSVGRFDVQFGLQVENPSKEAVTLKSIELTQIGSGSYQIRRDPATGSDRYTFNQTIGAGQTAAVSFWVHALQRVLPGTFGASEPVTLRAIVYFDSPSGQFHQVVQKVLGQFEGQ